MIKTFEKVNSGSKLTVNEIKKENKRKNVEFQVKDGKLTIVCDLKKLDTLNSNDISSSGKTYLLASSGGNIPLNGIYSHIKLGLNLFVSKDYVDGRKAIEQYKDTFKEERQKISEKDAKISTLEAELMELKALLKQVINK